MFSIGNLARWMSAGAESHDVGAGGRAPGAGPKRLGPSGRPSATRASPRRGLRQPEHQTGLRRALRRLNAWLDGRPLHDVTLAELHDAGRGSVERLDGGRRGVLPREAGRAARSRRRADGPGARRVPADRLDVRFVKDGVARAIRTLQALTKPEPVDRVVPLSPQMIGLRFTAASLVVGVERRVTAHSGRVGLA